MWILAFLFAVFVGFGLALHIVSSKGQSNDEHCDGKEYEKGVAKIWTE